MNVDLPQEQVVKDVTFVFQVRVLDSIDAQLHSNKKTFGNVYLSLTVVPKALFPRKSNSTLIKVIS